jgi:hypothetical protein
LGCLSRSKLNVAIALSNSSRSKLDLPMPSNRDPISSSGARNPR